MSNHDDQAPTGATALQRLAIEATAYYTVNESPEGFSAPPALLVALHGWGQQAKHFARIFRPLRKENILVVAPQAPNQFYLDWHTKKVGFSWLTVYEKDQSIRDLNNALLKLLDTLQARYHYDPNKIFLLGFSQGSSIAYRFAVSHKVPIAGMISCCADLPPDVATALPNVTAFPVLLGYAEKDALVPRTKVEKAEGILRAANFDCEVYPYPGEHKVSTDFVEKLGRWIAGTPAADPHNNDG